LNYHNVANHTEFYLGQLRFNVTSTDNIRCFKTSFTTLKAYINVFRGHIQCFECHNAAKHTDFCLGLLRLNATSSGNIGCFKKSFTTLTAYVNVIRGHIQCFELS
jgi:hypothetical protein